MELAVGAGHPSVTEFEELQQNRCNKVYYPDQQMLNIYINLLKPNDIYIYICRTAALTSRRYILNIYSTNIHTEYFKRPA